MVTISARVRIPEDLTGLLQCEWEQIISQAGYSERDAEIVRRYVVSKTPQIDVAVELDMARSTITRRRRRSTHERGTRQQSCK